MIKLNIKTLRCTVATVCLSIGLCGCDEFLDVVPDNVATLDHAFNDKATAERYLMTCYNFLPGMANVQSDPAYMGSGEFFSYKGEGEISRWMTDLIQNRQSAANPVYNSWDGENYGRSLFKALRDCNIFLENIDQPYDLSATDRKRWVAEVKFLKAFYHFWLLRHYGAIPLIKENLPVSATPAETHIYRASFDECVQYISDLIDEAVPDLPLKIQKEATELGRITRPIALGIKAKLWVTAASPLFNGNPDYAEMIDNRGVKLFNTTYDQTKWEKAAKACKVAIDIANEAGFHLFVAENLKYNLSERLEQQYQLRQVLWEPWNAETIWGFNTDIYNMQVFSLPKLDQYWTTNINVRGSMAPTFMVAESYYTKHGVPINEDESFPYENRFDTRISTDEENGYMLKDHETAVLNFDREPRFYASLGFDGSTWWGNGKTNESDMYVIRGKARETTGMRSWEHISITGYYAKKLQAFETIVPEGLYSPLQVQPAPFPVLRLADLYLLYAEALNESKESPDAEVYEYIDKVRERAGLKGVVESWERFSIYKDKPSTKDGMRSILQQERRIELAMEGQIMYDIRRWKKGIELWNGTVKAWNIKGEDVEDYYKVITIDELIFMSKHYLWPIKEHNILINPNLRQNFGW